MSDMSIWQIDPETLRLTGGPGRSMTDGEFHAQDWPRCPVCGDELLIDQLDVTMVRQVERHYVVGRWDCPNHCDQRAPAGVVTP